MKSKLRRIKQRRRPAVDDGAAAVDAGGAAAAVVDLDAARAEARIELLPSDAAGGERLAFDAVVNGTVAGHWALMRDGSAAMKWANPGTPPTETDPCCEGDEDLVRQAIREALPRELVAR